MTTTYVPWASPDGSGDTATIPGGVAITPIPQAGVGKPGQAPPAQAYSTRVGTVPTPRPTGFDPVAGNWLASAGITSTPISGGTTVPGVVQIKPQGGYEGHTVYVTTDSGSGTSTSSDKPPKEPSSGLNTGSNSNISPQDSSGLPSIWLVVAGVLFLVVLIKLRSH